MRLAIIAEDKKPNVCIDLDGLLAYYESNQGMHNIGDLLDGAREFLDKVAEMARIIILTSRCSIEPETAATVEKWLNKHKLKYDEVWNGPGKPPALAYVDDRGVNCAPQYDKDAYKNALTQIRGLIDRRKK